MEVLEPVELVFELEEVAVSDFVLVLLDEDLVVTELDERDLEEVVPR